MFCLILTFFLFTTTIFYYSIQSHTLTDTQYNVNRLIIPLITQSLDINFTNNSKNWSVKGNEIWLVMYLHFSANIKHLYNISTTSAQRFQLWSNIVQISYKCFVWLFNKCQIGDNMKKNNHVCIKNTKFEKRPINPQLADLCPTKHILPWPVSRECYRTACSWVR